MSDFKEKKTVVKTFKRILKSNGEKKKKQRAVTNNAIRNLIQYLEANCLDLEGIFRISGNAVKVKELKKSLDNEEEIDFSKITDKHTISGALKAFLRESDEPVLTFELYKNFLGVMQTNEIKDKKTKVSFIKSIISALPKENFDLVQTLLKFLYTLQLNSGVNKMSSTNLAIVFSPSILRPKESTLETMMLDSNITNEVVKLMIEEFNTLFEVNNTILYKLKSQDLGIKRELSLQDQLEEAQQKIEQLSKQLAEESRERSILETYNNTVELKLAELTENYKLIQEERDGISELLIEYKETMKNLNEDNDKLKENNGNLSKSLESEKQLSTQLSKDIETLKTTSSRELEESSTKLRASRNEIEKLKQDINSSNEGKEVLSTKLNKLVKERDDANSQLERVQAELSLLSTANTSGRKSTHKGKDKFDKKTYENRISQLEKDKYSLSEQVSKLQKQLNTLNSSNNNSTTSAGSTTTTGGSAWSIGKKPQQAITPPPIDEDDLVSVKKFAFYWLILALKTDSMNRGKNCNINSGDVMEELLAKNIRVALWNDFVLKKLKELD